MFIVYAFQFHLRNQKMSATDLRWYTYTLNTGKYKYLHYFYQKYKLNKMEISLNQGTLHGQGKMIWTVKWSSRHLENYKTKYLEIKHQL